MRQIVQTAFGAGRQAATAAVNHGDAAADADAASADAGAAAHRAIGLAVVTARGG
ncbi:hypothetical protein [Bradyrhizobium sp. USDA 10063]